MRDPLAEVVDRLRRDASIRGARRELRANFLNNVGDVFERYGFSVTRQFLRSQRERRELCAQADACLSALDCMEGSEAIARSRAIGRLLFKTLGSLDFGGEKPVSAAAKPAAQTGGGYR